MLHLVGWRQAYDPAKSIFDSLTHTESGLYFNDAHPMLTLDNIRSAMPDDYGFSYDEWDSHVIYHAKSKISHNEKVWFALEDNQGAEPTEDSDKWTAYDFFNDFLDEVTRAGINKTIQTFITMKQVDSETRTLLEHRTFFSGAGRIAATIENTSKLVGFEIIPANEPGVTARVERIGLQMTGATGTIRLYLFHSSQPGPIKTVDVEYTKTNGGFQWFEIPDMYLPYASDDTNTGGSWFLCYNQDELPQGMQAVNVSKDWSRDPCGTCNIGNVREWHELMRFVKIRPFMVGAPSDFKDFPELWDVGRTMYTNTQNYGLNVQVTVGCDLTDFFVRQRGIFATALQLQTAENLLRMLATNPNVRVNRNQTNASDQYMQIMNDLDAPMTNKQGYFARQLKDAYRALRLDTQGISRLCLTCHNGGIRWGCATI